MSYQKQLKKQKRKQMALEKQKQADRRNAGTGQSSNGSTWKTVLALILGTYLIIQFNASADAATIVGLLP